MVTNTGALQGRYRIDRDIATGGMGSVFAATDVRLRREVALKLMKDDLRPDRSFVERFHREALAAAALSHPNIATIYDYGEDGSRHFIVMELIHGRDLAMVMRQEAPLAWERAATIAAQIADALAYAHEAGVVHRDIKPANVMINDQGQVKVTDFGIARATGDASLTAAGSILGTAHYMSPEQARGESVGPGSDIYSLGVVLYEMLTGAVPFISDSPISVALRHLSDDIPAPSELNPLLPADLDRIVEQATAKAPENRFATAADMSAALGRALRSDGVTTLLASANPPTPNTALDTEPARAMILGRPVPWEIAGVRRVAWWVLGAIAVIALLLVLRVAPFDRTAATGHSRRTTTPQNRSAGTGRVTIADVRTLPYAEAETKLRAEGLVPHKIVVTGDAPHDAVLYTKPAGGQLVKKGAPVLVYVSSGPPAGGKHGQEHGKKKGKDKKD
ncbi:MAG: protein kinase [Actinomycetota bacterium]|nr:protein kinase [Actinomycetota bacterium]